ncbi:MAG: MotA/TolQ/ExbB proton channel family protein [Phycisphaeraceae bacterium]|nr:MotA/TolQ/ExbB proton channel family protein [Phycisphaeraceae bacterium]
MSLFSESHILLQQAVPESAGSLVSTVLDLVIKGGWSMVPLGLCSLVAVTLIVERLIMTRAVRISPPGLQEKLKGLKRHPRQALAACAAEASPMARVLHATIKARHETREMQDKLAGEAGEREVQKLRLRMRLLSVLPQVATMLGLLGTVIGMIRTFTVIAASGENLGKTERLAQGIYEAWTATAAGLFIAIPTLIAYHVILGRIDRGAAQLDAGVLAWRESEALDEVVVDAPAREVEPALDGDLVLAKG